MRLVNSWVRDSYICVELISARSKTTKTRDKHAPVTKTFECNAIASHLPANVCYS